MESPTETFYRALHNIVGVPYTPPVAAPVKPHTRRRTIGAQLTITELGLKWICSVDFSVSHGEVDDYESIGICTGNSEWLEVEYENLSEHSKEAIALECQLVLAEPIE